MPILKVGAVHLSYVEKGSGDPILFIPGLIGLAAQWSHQVDYFAKNYRAVAFDHRGVGYRDNLVHEYTTSLLAAARRREARPRPGIPCDSLPN